NGTLRLLVVPVQNGTVEVANASTFTIASGNVNLTFPDWANGGTVLMRGGDVRAATDGSTRLTNQVGAAITGAGTIEAVVRNFGLINGSNGNLTLVFGLIGNTNSGTLSANIGGNLIDGIASNHVVINSATIALQGGTLFSGNITNVTATGYVGDFGTVAAA